MSRGAFSAPSAPCPCQVVERLSATAISVAILLMPSARPGLNPASTCSAYAAALSPDSTIFCVILVLRLDNASKCHSNVSSALSSSISRTNASSGRTSRMSQWNGCCSGNSVVPREPAMKAPSKANLAGGSFQFAISVRYCHANSRLTSVSIECSSCRAISLIVSNQARALSG